MRFAPLALALVAALAAAAFAWREHQALGTAQAALSESQAQLKKAQADLRGMSAEMESLRKQAAEHKAALDHQQVELRAAQSFLDTERAASARLREELVKMKEALAVAGRQRGAPPPSQAGGLPAYAPPMLVRPPPVGVRLAPGSGGAAVGAPMPARPALPAQ